jgi:NAD(P)-dependent dehydrogenase (short-subunit alcohol dehydrogenase family)
MELSGASAIVTGGASGLGLATARQLTGRGVATVIVDLPSSDGEAVAAGLGEHAVFAPADVTDADAVAAAVKVAAGLAPLRAVVHCAGRGGTVRAVERNGQPGSLELFEEIVRVNVIGSWNVLRLAAACMAASEPAGGERGVIVLTASVAAWEGQIGQLPYATSKGGIVSMTLVAARDLASKLIRVCTIAPGAFDTPILSRFSDEIKDRLAAAVPHPSRLGAPDEYAMLALHILANPMLNGETIRLDGAVRMPPR